jgi:quinol monooxygenase YgiN
VNEDARRLRAPHDLLHIKRDAGRDFSRDVETGHRWDRAEPPAETKLNRLDNLPVTHRVWSDMRSFEGYVSHQMFIDQDAPGHIIAVGRWRSRADAESVRDKYKHSETIRQLTALLARPRDRWVTIEEEVIAGSSQGSDVPA